MYLLFEILLFTIIMMLMMFRLKFKIYSPVYVIIMGYVFWTLAGYVFYTQVDIPFVSYPHINSATLSSFYETTVLIGAMLIAFGFGSLCYLYVLSPFFGIRARPVMLRDHSFPEVDVSAIYKLKYYHSRFRRPLQFLFCLALLCLILGVGVGNLIYREVYLVDDFYLLKIVGVTLSPIAVLGSGYMYGVNRSWWLFLIVSILFEIVLFSIGTRRMAFVPVLFFAGMFLADSNIRFIKLSILLSILIMPFLMFIPLVLRGLPEQGLVPYASFLISSYGELESPYGGSFLTYVTQNVLTGFPLTAYIMNEQALDIRGFLVSINPLPGFLIGWAEVAAEMRVNIYIPYNAIGELLNYGVWVASGYFFSVGILTTHFDMKVRAELIFGRRFFAIFIVAFVTLFMIFSTMYHLRSATRFLYYVIFVLVSVNLMATVKKRSATKSRRIERNRLQPG